MGWFGKQVEDAIRNILTDIKEALLGFANDIFEALLNPIVGVPAPESNSRYIVVGTPRMHHGRASTRISISSISCR